MSLTKVTQAMILGGVESVLDYGADPTGATDSTTAIQAAINAASLNGNAVYLPVGFYKVSKQGANNYCLNLAVPTVSPWRQITLIGVGNSGTPYELTNTENYGSTLFVNSPAADVPILSILGSRGNIIRDINLKGNGGKAIADTMAIELVDSNANMIISNCSFDGFETGVKVTGSLNNEAVTIEQCNFWTIKYCVLNEGNESYQIRMVRNNAYTECDWLFKSVANGLGEIMADAKLVQNMAVVKQGLVWLSSPGLTANTRGVLVIDQNTMESSTGNDPVVFYTDSVSPVNGLSLIITKNVFNTADTAAVYSPSYRFIKYRGKGSFKFDDNKISGPRQVFEIATYGNSTPVAAASFSNNYFTNRPIIRYDASTAYPTILEANNYWDNECSQSIGGGSVATVFPGFPGVKENGKTLSFLYTPLFSTLTLRAGSKYSINSSGGTVTEAFCRVSGTWGTLSGVSATLTNGDTFATITVAGADRLKIYGGCFISIGAATGLEVADVIGSIIYLVDPYVGATQTNQTVDFFNTGYVRQVCENASAAPTTGTWFVGDLTWNVAPVAGGTPGWVCTAAGVPGTWKAMANIAV
jgi:hypothetical protein